MSSKPLVFLMLSGGVDSSVSAVKLLQKNYEVIAVFIKNWSIDQLTKLGADEDLYKCFWKEDAEDAKKVASQLQIPFYIWDFQEEYRTKVVEYMIQGYKIGITPNPDVMCNSVIKFGIFYEKAMQMGADFVATGHYARIGQTKDGQDCILKGKDSNKDQTYFIWKILQNQLPKILFPIGDFDTKEELRQFASQHNLVTAQKKDSQGICFIGKMSLRDLLLQTIGEKDGDIIDYHNGEILGKHNGAHIYTIGQRNGLGLAGGPWFVYKIDIPQNIVYVVHQDQEKLLLQEDLLAVDINWQVDLAKYFKLFPTSSNSTDNLNFSCQAQIRYRQKGQDCQVSYNPQTNSAKVIFQEKVKAVAKGQSVVFYDDEVLLGGGVIS